MWAAKSSATCTDRLKCETGNSKRKILYWVKKMSRIAKKAIKVSDKLTVNIGSGTVTLKGKLGEKVLSIHPSVSVVQEGDVIKVQPNEQSKAAWAQAGTTRALLNNIIIGVSEGFIKTLNLVGVGYRAQAKGTTLNLNLGFSHPVEFKMPDGVSVETPSQTEIVLKSSDKQLLGQTAANIRSFRKPEPYKGKGIRYSDEVIKRKEAKKK